jgi:hypothetical protein
MSSDKETLRLEVEASRFCDGCPQIYSQLKCRCLLIRLGRNPGEKVLAFGLKTLRDLIDIFTKMTVFEKEAGTPTFKVLVSCSSKICFILVLKPEWSKTAKSANRKSLLVTFLKNLINNSNRRKQFQSTFKHFEIKSLRVRV